MSANYEQISRRRFLTRSARTAGGVIAAVSLASCNALQTSPICKPGSKIRFGLVTYLWGRDWSLPTLIANCEKAKVFGVELRTTHSHGVEPSLNASRRKDVKKTFC